MSQQVDQSFINFCRAWHESGPGKGTATDLLPLALIHLPEISTAIGHGRLIRLGMMLGRWRGEKIEMAGFCFIIRSAGFRAGLQYWMIESIHHDPLGELGREKR